MVKLVKDENFKTDKLYLAFYGWKWDESLTEHIVNHFLDNYFNKFILYCAKNDLNIEYYNELIKQYKNFKEDKDKFDRNLSSINSQYCDILWKFREKIANWVLDNIFINFSVLCLYIKYYNIVAEEKNNWSRIASYRIGY